MPATDAAAPLRLSSDGGNYRRRSLYSKQPFVEKLTAGRFSFLLVAKPGDHKSLFQDVDGLRRATCWTAIIPSTAANATSTSGSPVCR